MGSYSLYFPATLYVGLVHHAAHATEVVNMRMRVDDGDYRTGRLPIFSLMKSCAALAI